MERRRPPIGLHDRAMSAGSIVLHVLAKAGAANFRHIVQGPLAKSHGSHLNENSFYTAIARLCRRKMIDKGGYGYALTPNGEWAAMKAAVQRGMFTEQSRRGSWDGRWRLVLFDFPESKRPYRDYVRMVLRRSGFKEFQRSAWMTPYRLQNFMAVLFRDQRISGHIRVITTQDISYDRDLRRKFKLT